MSIGTFTLIGTSTGRRLIAPATVAATGPVMAADIAQVAAATGPGTEEVIAPAVAAIAAAAMVAGTEVAEAIGAAAVTAAKRIRSEGAQGAALLIVAPSALAL